MYAVRFIQFGVVQNSGVFINSNDIVIRHICITMAGCHQVSHIDIKFTQAG